MKNNRVKKEEILPPPYPLPLVPKPASPNGAKPNTME
jgi:hypothetical protein